MHDLKYFMARVICKLKKGDDEVYSRFFRKEGCKIGKECHIYSNIVTPEPYLIEIGDNVTISNEVALITHDNSICKPDPNYSDLFGTIIIGNNCFIGSHSIILPGVTLSDSIIVAAGSVVTKSFFQSRIIIGGNPARIIGDWDDFIEKRRDFFMNINGLDKQSKKNLIINSDKILKGR